MKKLKLQNDSYKILLSDFKDWLDILGYNEKAVYYTPIFIQEFFYWLENHDIQRLEQITIDTVKAYYKYLGERSNQRTSGGLSKAYLNKHQNALRKFREYLKKHGARTFKIHLRLEKKESAIKDILTQSEVKQLFEVTSYSSKYQRTRLRDRAILVILYSCGLRRKEAVSLDIGDILFDAGRVFVRQGKNYKERYVPINKHNLRILEDYIYEARPMYNGSHGTEALLINKYGNRMHGQGMSRRLQHLLTLVDDQTLKEKHITPHCLRHSIATHLLQQGMRIEDIQQFLGHSSFKINTDIHTFTRIIMKDYYTYLEELQHSEQTIKTNLYNINKLKQWCRSKRTKPENLTYKQVLNYINHLKTTNQPQTINRHIWAIKHYCTYLIEQGYRTDNIADDLKVRGERKKVFHNLLTSDELEDLFYSYETDKIWKGNFYYKATAKRNKMVVGLLVYQGVLSNNFKSLEVEHVDLRKGTIYIPSTRRNAWRKLALKPWQIIELKEYIEEIRPILQDHIGTNDEKLFPLNTPQFNTILHPILKKLKTYNQKVTNNTHIRASVIVNWLGQYNIRKVQQMAGHRHINSTESYKQDNLESLHEAIDKFHPIH